MPESPKKTWQRVLGAAFTLALLVLVGWLTSRQLGDMDWADVSNAISSYSVLTLAVAFSAVLAGYAAVSQYDLVGRYYTGHSLPVRRVMAISFIGYTFSLNLGALIGGLGFRYRLYSKAELSTATTTKVIGLSILGNWSGYVLLAGLLFAFAPPQLPDEWHVAPMGLRALGAGLLLATAAYWWLCHKRGGETLEFAGHSLIVPPLGMAAVQYGLSLLSWCAIATLIHSLLPNEVSWFLVLAALLTSGIAAALSHVPGGVGVIELVFIAMLGHVVPESAIVAALLGYRCLYFLLPLLLAVCLYAVIEVSHARASARSADRSEATA